MYILLHLPLVKNYRDQTHTQYRYPENIYSAYYVAYLFYHKRSQTQTHYITVLTILTRGRALRKDHVWPDYRVKTAATPRKNN